MPRQTLSRIANNLLNALYPRLCAVTGRALAAGEEGVRLDVLATFAQTHYHLHPYHNALLDRWIATPGITAAAGCFVFEAGGGVQALLHALKYQHRPDAGQMAGRFYGGLVAGGPLVAGVTAIVPVPLHPAKLRRRGYNQAAAVANGLALATGIPHHPTGLARLKDTPSQTTLDRQERRQNVAGAFRATAPVAGAVLLVDDVATTGATLAEAAEALLAAGAAEVRIATLAVAD